MSRTAQTQVGKYYNYDRPHGGLDGQTTYERLRQKTQTETPSEAELQQRHMLELRAADL